MTEDTFALNSPEDDRDEIEAALATAEARDVRPERGRPARSPKQAKALQHYRDRVGARLIAEDRGELDQIRTAHQAEAQKFVEDEKAAAIERSSDRLAILRSRIGAARAATEDIMSRESQAPVSRFHDRIHLATYSEFRVQGNSLTDDLVKEPWANRVKVKDDWSHLTSHEWRSGVGFVFEWTNPNSHAVVLDASALVALNGWCYVGAGSSFWGDENEIYLDVLTTLQLTVSDNHPPFQPEQTVVVGNISAKDGGFLGVGEVDQSEMTGFYAMQYRGLVVPSGGRALFEAISRTRAIVSGDCSAIADFWSGDFQVMCLGVTLTIV